MSFSIAFFYKEIMDKKYQKICLVHYHEIGLKGANRSYFERQLEKNIKDVLHFHDIKDFLLRRISGRILILLDTTIDDIKSLEIFNLVSKIPGCARVSCGYKCEQDVNDMISAGCKVMIDAQDSGEVESFKVSARRNHTNFNLDSMELNQIVGGNISDAFPDVKVKMKDPTLDIRLEVIENAAYVYGISISGVGGLPVGTCGKLVGMLSSGIDSPVALWTMARRGASVIAVHFSGAPVVSNESEYLVKEICDVFKKSGCISKLYIVRIGKYQKMIAQDCPERLRIILYRRFMYRIAERVAQIEEAKALITGESLGQVASQTVENLACTNAAVDIQVFRPLIGSDKQEIIDRANMIGTFDLSSEKAPDCCTLYMPKKPETHAKLKYVRLAEKDFPYKEWIKESLSNAEIINY